MDRVKEMPRGAAHVERWCAEFERACRGRGVRVTPQRVAVYRALAEDATHPTAEQVYARLRPDLPSLSPATVYRILDSLERERLIRRVGATRGVGRYDANLEPHQHVVCRRCGRMTDVQMPALSALRLRERAVPGFVVEGLDIRIVGRCATCRRPH
ncbi:MAG: transcriptional repressor [Deltaproteobacteria bacterium]|nr:MAG: transcriptional repressor [Deltaproteobacteria bacterium]